MLEFLCDGFLQFNVIFETLMGKERAQKSKESVETFKKAVQDEKNKRSLISFPEKSNKDREELLTQKQSLENENKQLQLKELIREKVGDEIKGIEKIEAFPTWFNDRCAVIINKEKNLLKKSMYNL